jgi:hypothetical protein
MPTAAGQFRTVVLAGLNDTDGDDTLDITFRDLGGDPYWVVNGVEIVQTDPVFVATAAVADASQLVVLGFEEMMILSGGNAESDSPPWLFRPATVDRVLADAVLDDLPYRWKETRATDDAIERLVKRRPSEPDDLDTVLAQWSDALTTEATLD